MYQHILNDLIHYWLITPEADHESTESFALKEGLIENRSDSFSEYIHEEHNHFCKRSRAKKEWDPIKGLPTDNTPIGSNPFMDNTDVNL